MDETTNGKINNDIQDKVLQFGRMLKQKGILVNKLLIFGSYAKGKASSYSDIDVCVVSENFGKDPIEEMQYLFKERRNIDNRIEPHPASLEEYNLTESSLMWEIRKYGLELSGLL